MIGEVTVKKDYLQVFEIEPIKDNLLRIEHGQEVPKYKKEIIVSNVGINSKVKLFVIDAGEYSTMMLSEEYQKEKEVETLEGELQWVKQ